MAESNRTERTKLSLKPEEADVIERAAEQIGLPVATYARLGALEKARRDLGQLDANRNTAQRHPQAA